MNQINPNARPGGVAGRCDSRFQELQELLQSNITAKTELGASITVNIDGDNVVNMWGGYADDMRTQPWQADTIVNVFSTTKLVSSLAMLILVDRGLLDPFEKVSTYWPEFAQNGKENVEVRHIMSHTAGLPGWEEPMEISDLYDFDRATEKLAAQAPWWTPGTASGYHSFTQGFLVGKLIRQITSKSLKQFIAEDIAAPLGADFQMGVQDCDMSRVTDVTPISFDSLGDPPDKSSIIYKSNYNPIFSFEAANTQAWRQAELGAVNGHGNSCSIARIISVISLGGELDGKRFLKPETVDLIFQQQTKGTDLVIGMPVCFGMGFGLAVPEFFLGRATPSGRLCFWGGAGGSIGLMDLDRRMTVSYTPNKMGLDGLDWSYVRCIYKALGVKL
ncbi:beta-lactamase [Aspergillus ambiguus]|uniref:serine hydrolase domain-containing protein n=1 Tax=Aspergillus ambiguus TaxID=176160 RepID=UPI003CCD09F1